jgi:hypothetical protein
MNKEAENEKKITNLYWVRVIARAFPSVGDRFRSSGLDSSIKAAFFAAKSRIEWE